MIKALDAHLKSQSCRKMAQQGYPSFLLDTKAVRPLSGF